MSDHLTLCSEERLKELLQIERNFEAMKSFVEARRVQINELMDEVGIFKAKTAKLKSLLLLTDPAVETYEMNDMTTTQWMEYIRCFPDEGEVKS